MHVIYAFIRIQIIVEIKTIIVVLVRVLPVRVLPVRVLPVRVLPVRVLPVRVLPVRVLPVRVLPVRVLLVRVLLVQSSPVQSAKYHMPVVVIYLTELSNRNITATRFFTGIARVSGRNNYSQLSANGHSRKRTALLTDGFLNPRFYLPVKLSIYTFP